MKQYIDKDALVAEIERQQRKLCVLSQSNEVELRKNAAMQNGVYCNLLSFLDTLEVKEVDLDTDFGVCWGEYCDCGGNINDYKIAKHFFELGFNVRKGK